MTVDAWLTWACEDARRRGLPALVPLLEGLAPATRALRAAEWNDAADRPSAPASDASDRERTR